jgi:hypothetical protein
VTDPHRRLALPGALAAAAFLLLLARAVTVSADPDDRAPALGRTVAAADTDTVVVRRPDSLAAPDSLIAGDTLVTDSLLGRDSVVGVPTLPPMAGKPDSLLVPVPIAAADTVRADTVRADTVRSDSLARLYFPELPRGDPGAGFGRVRVPGTGDCCGQRRARADRR